MYLYSSHFQFKPGDKVRVSSDQKLLEKLQEGHGGWVSNMKKVTWNAIVLWVSVVQSIARWFLMEFMHAQKNIVFKFSSE